MGTLIYQFGRLDPNMNTIDFTIEDKIKHKDKGEYKDKNEYEYKDEYKDEYKKILSSYALKEYLTSNIKDNFDEENRVEVVTIFPVSLAFNEACAKSNLQDSIKQKIEKIIKDEKYRTDFLKDPEDFFKDLPYYKETDHFLIINSIGNYSDINFEASLKLIEFQIFTNMFENYLNNKVKKIFIDVSSGLNIYLTALIEAGRKILEYDRYINYPSYNSCKNEDKKLELFIVFSDPIIGAPKSKKKIYYDYKVDLKISFALPISKMDLIESHIWSKVFKIFNPEKFSNDEKIELGKKKEKLRKQLENLAILFSSIYNGTPLAIFTFDFDTPQEINEMIEDILKYTRKNVFSNFISNTIDYDYESIYKVLYSLALYKNIIAKINTLNNENTVLNNKVSINFNSKEPTLEDIEILVDSDYSIYSLLQFDLPKSIIKKEIDKYKYSNLNIIFSEDKSTGKGLTYKDVYKELKIYDKPENQYVKLALLHDDKYEEKSSNINFVSRNFFAHAGFERTITNIRNVSKINRPINKSVEVDEKELNNCNINNDEKTVQFCYDKKYLDNIKKELINKLP